ncbi:MarR family winged helix-turn-helix transcriptional regulator [Pseudarthrobacter sp. J1763]|uniref:MarR family winged helix-turn-helix transcriptional regulator n=1 Tax=Pseudarthrobacter sp. J1763 TaxID=3420445 RepID=UPI003D2C7CE6
MSDYVDTMRQQWASIYPELDTEAAGVVARITRIARMIQLRGDVVLAEHGVTRDEFELMSLLARSAGPLTPSALAASQITSAAAVTKRLKKLDDAGWVRREVNPSDGRGALIHLTQEGSSVLRPIIDAVAKFDSALLGELTANDSEQLANQLRALLTSVEGPAENA